MNTRNRANRTTATAIFCLALLSLLIVPVAHAQGAAATFEFPLGRSNQVYRDSMKIVLDVLGQGQNRWVLHPGTNSFIDRVGCLEDTCGWNGNFYPVLYFDGVRTPAPGACDIASYFMKVAFKYGLFWDKTLKHVRPLYGVEEEFWISIWNPGQDAWVENPYPHDIAFVCSIDGDVLKIWMEGLDGSSVAETQEIVSEDIKIAYLSGPLDTSSEGTVAPSAAPVVSNATSITAPMSFETLPFVVDRRSEAAAVMPAVYNSDRGVTTDIVIHEAWLAALCKTTPEYAMAVDGPRLTAGWQAKNGWNKPGYAVVVKWADQGEFAQADWIANLDTLTYGVGVDGVNEKAIHIAFVGYPCDSDMTYSQRNSIVALTRALIAKFGVPIENVLAHKEWGGHADPRGVDMNVFRCQVQTHAGCTVSELVLPTGGVVAPDAPMVDLPIEFLQGGIEPEEAMAIDIAQVQNNAKSNPVFPKLLALLGIVSGIAALNKEKRQIGFLGLLLTVVLWLFAGGGS